MSRNPAPEKVAALDAAFETLGITLHFSEHTPFYRDRQEALLAALQAAGYDVARIEEGERPVLADVLRCLDVAHEAWRQAHKNGGGWFFAGADGPFDTTVGESRRRLRAALAPRDEEAGNG